MNKNEKQFKTNPDLEFEIMLQLDSVGKFLIDKKFKEMKSIVIDAWAKIPEPKLKYDESFHVSELMCEISIGLNDFKLGDEWLEKYKKADLTRIDSGERIFMEARFAYAKEDFEKAKVLFEKADKMSEGRFFQNPSNLEYFKFFKKKK